MPRLAVRPVLVAVALIGVAVAVPAVAATRDQGGAQALGLPGSPLPSSVPLPGGLVPGTQLPSSVPLPLPSVGVPPLPVPSLPAVPLPKLPLPLPTLPIPAVPPVVPPPTTKAPAPAPPAQPPAPAAPGSDPGLSPYDGAVPPPFTGTVPLDANKAYAFKDWRAAGGTFTPDGTAVIAADRAAFDQQQARNASHHRTELAAALVVLAGLGAVGGLAVRRRLHQTG